MVVRISVREQLAQFAAYKTAEIVPPPQALSPIYMSKEQSDDSRRALAIAYSQIPLDCRDGHIQVFEVPFDIQDDTRQYCGRGYSQVPLDNDGCPQDCVEEPFDIRDDDGKIIGHGCFPPLGRTGPSWTSKGWVKLADKTDFSCRKFFSKVLVFEKNGLVARGWGDGTFLIKSGSGRYGAAAVFRITDPNHPFIARNCGPVKSVWIQKTDKEIPSPFYRFRSTYPTGEGPGCDDFSELEDVLQLSVTPYLDTYAKENQREGLRLFACGLSAAEQPNSPEATTLLGRLVRKSLFEPRVMSLVKSFLS